MPTDGSGAFTLPLTYGAQSLGTQTWRVVVRNSTGVFYSNEFALLREPAAVTVKAQSAGTKPVGQLTYAWGRALGAPESQVWTEVELAGNHHLTPVRQGRVRGVVHAELNAGKTPGQLLLDISFDSRYVAQVIIREAHADRTPERIRSRNAALRGGWIAC